MKKRKRRLLAGFCSLLLGAALLLPGCGGTPQGESSAPEENRNTEEYAGVTNMEALLQAHDTIVTAQYGKSGEAYQEDGQWYVDTTYVVQESLRGDLQPGESVTLREPAQGGEKPAYSWYVNENSTDSTLLFLIKEDGGYRISAPTLSMQPVVLNEKSGEREILWLNGTKRRTIEGTHTVVYAAARGRYGGEEDYENVLPHCVSEKLNPTLEVVSTLRELYHVVDVADGKTATQMVDSSAAAALVTILNQSPAYREDGRWYRDMTVSLQQVYKDPHNQLAGETCALRVEVGSPNQPVSMEGSYVALFHQGVGPLSLQGDLYDSLLTVSPRQVGQRENEIQWFGYPCRQAVNGGLVKTGDLAEYCTAP